MKRAYIFIISAGILFSGTFYGVNKGKPYLGEPLDVGITDVTESSLELQWVDNSTGETEFWIWRSSESENGPWGTEPVMVFSSPDPAGKGKDISWNDVYMDRGRTYWYKIVAKKGDIESEASEVKSATTLYSNLYSNPVK